MKLVYFEAAAANQLVYSSVQVAPGCYTILDRIQPVLAASDSGVIATTMFEKQVVTLWPEDAANLVQGATGIFY
jgi:hypothetical protein